jgi:hypothetical protein
MKAEESGAGLPPSTPPSTPPKRRWQQLLDWYLGWLGRIFTGKI